jgi:uncharacterized protein YggU (UPF0235/DUF167 family)
MDGMDDGLRRTLADAGTVDVTVRVRPGARQTRLKERMADGAWKIDVSAAPEDGAANELLRRFVAAGFGVPPSCVEILSGQTSREKRLRITAARP